MYELELSISVVAMNNVRKFFTFRTRGILHLSQSKYPLHYSCHFEKPVFLFKRSFTSIVRENPIQIPEPDQGPRYD